MSYAHSQNDRGERHDLVAHLRGVAELAESFAADLNCPGAARYLGLWHDLGKFSTAFQNYLLACESKPEAHGRSPDHKAAGTLLAAQHFGLAALAARGHHGGLGTPGELRNWLATRRSDPLVEEALKKARTGLPDLDPTESISLPAHVEKDPHSAELFLRLLFSALVDADFLDTEQHFSPQRTMQRGSSIGLETLWERFERSQLRVTGQRVDTVGQVRHEIYSACLAAAEQPSGLFRLTVPTGGGKTRSAMAFALRHALQHGQSRVIVAVPFISITEQTADVYREIFEADAGDPVVLEHHSSAFTETEEEEFVPHRQWQRLASENWDAPIVVTTTVQLFESLFAANTSRCRKLHHLARSVILLDEAQALPSHLLQPILDALQELCTHFGSTVVLSTATQPAFEAIPVFKAAAAREIVPDPARFFDALRRVDYQWETNLSLPWGQVANLMRRERQALAVLNTKKDALALLDALEDPEALHLSTLLCGAHRRAVINEVKKRLAGRQPCRLVSTQVVEAGVDLDFPLVLRALGPLDGIIQAAGRCNREGRLARGRVIVFHPEEGGCPPGAYRTGTGITGVLLGGGPLDPDDPGVPRLYFERLFGALETDREGIQKLRAALNYPETSRRFKMIDGSTESVAVGYGSPAQLHWLDGLLDRLRRQTPDSRMLLRQIQPYLVSVRTREADLYHRRGLIDPVLPGLGRWLGSYDPVRGLTGDDPDPDALVV